MCGRKWPDVSCRAVRPDPDQGAFVGLCAALYHARENDFQAVRTAGCDTLPVPHNLAHLLQYQAGVIRNQPLFGFWPASMAPRLDAWLANHARRDMRGWIASIQVRAIDSAFRFYNLKMDWKNTRLHSRY